MVCLVLEGFVNVGRTVFVEKSLVDVLGHSVAVQKLRGMWAVGRPRYWLFKTILGLEPAESGNVKIGETVKISYVDQ